MVFINALLHPIHLIVKIKVFLCKEYDVLKAFVEDKPL